MSNAQYTNVNNVKRVKQTHDDKHNLETRWQLIFKRRKRVEEDFQTPDLVRTCTHVVEQR